MTSPIYDADGAHFLLGDDKDFDKNRKKRPDLPRNNAKQRRALIGDPRNDENTIVSQLHAAFLRFHNAVLDRVVGGAAKADAFGKTQRLVRWHYQWIVLHDYLRRIVGEKTYKAVVGGPGKIPNLKFYKVKGRFAFMPVEFSAAAFRFGHSQVRPSYALNNIILQATPNEQPFGKKKARFNRIPIFSNVDTKNSALPLANLNGFRALPDFWAVDWGFFLKGVKPQKPPPKAKLPQPSYRIDTLLVDPLTSLPTFQAAPQELRALAARNLLRGWRLGLPSGQAVARLMSIPALTDAQLFDHAEPARRKARRKVLSDHPILAGNAPLWFYILREAELLHQGLHLGPVGGTIVAEVFAGLMLEDRHSFLAQEPQWRPTLPAAKKGDFTIADLINFADG